MNIERYQDNTFKKEILVGVINGAIAAKLAVPRSLLDNICMAKVEIKAVWYYLQLKLYIRSGNPAMVNLVVP